jgi:mRNA-degrading endonuclease toxin of MazEF toxin-antitoxin module
VTDLGLAQDSMLTSLGLLLVVVAIGLVGGLLWRAWRAVGGPQPGQVWWAEVPFEDGHGSKDRPVVVLRRDGGHRVVLMVSSQDKAGRRGWVALDRRGWDRRPGRSWVRTDREIPLRGRDFRRRAGRCPAETWALLRDG